jgi:choline kinase
MKALILAAGEGSRLRPHTLDRPKCLVEVDGRSLLDRQLDVLASESIRTVILIGGYRAEMLRREGIELRINPLYAETNMVWTLFCAEADLEGDLIVSYGDIVYSREVLSTLLKSEDDIAVTIDLNWENYWRTRHENPMDDAETLKLSSDGRIIEIGQKPKSLKEIQGQYMGLMKFSAKGVTMLSKVYHNAKKGGNLCGKPVKKAYLTDLLQAMIDSGYRVSAVPVHSGWVEVDTSKDLYSKETKTRLHFIQNNLIGY